MTVYIQTNKGLVPIGGAGGTITKEVIINALGYTPSSFDGDYNKLYNKPNVAIDVNIATSTQIKNLFK